MKMRILYYESVAFKLARGIPIAGRFFDIFCVLLVTLLRALSGIQVASGLDKCKRPAQTLKLYEFEGCPYCRKVREALCVLDLDVMVYPCPRETMKAYGVCEKSRFRPEVAKQGGEMAFPFFVDEGAGVKMNGSAEICAYLWKTYGGEAVPPLSYRVGQLLDRTPLRFVPALCRPLLEHGMLRAPSKAAERPLELWGYEASPFVRIVRETLCVLELPYLMHNVAHGSVEKRAKFTELFGTKLSAVRRKAGIVQVPLLVDPNTGEEVLESADIVAYLYRTYRDGPPSEETWLDFGTGGVKQGHHGFVEKSPAGKAD